VGEDALDPAALVAPHATKAGREETAIVLSPRARPELAIVVDSWHPALPWSEAGEFHAVTYTLAALTSTRLPMDGMESASGARERRPHADVTLPERWRDAAPARVASFAAGRHCARAALARASARDTLPPAGAVEAATNATSPLPAPATDPTLGAWPNGAARWPAGFVGSITHTADRAIAVVASDRRLLAIGIDCERIMDAASADDVAPHVVPELEALLAGAGLADVEERPLVTTLVFSAKESLYKALHPLVDEFFDFTDVRAERLDMTSHTLDLRLLRPLGREPGLGRNAAAFDAGTSFTARFALMPREVVTLLELPIVPSAGQGATTRASDHLNQDSGSPSRTSMPSRRHAAP
jgi:enterobactin synthetase component D